MSYQDPNQPFGAPPPQQQGQPDAWGQQSGQQLGTWAQPGAAPQNSGQGWGAPQGQQAPQQPNYGAAPGYGQPGQSGPQDFAQQQFNQQQQQGYGQGYPGGQPGYMPQSDFGSGGYGQGYPPPNQGNSTLATVALWLGIFFGFGVINLVISIMAIAETGPGKKLGRNKAVTGLILTIAWGIVFSAIFLAVSNHEKNVINSELTPSYAATAGVTTGATTGAVGAQATGASSDPGCQAAQTAFNTYSQNAESGGLTAIQTLGNALVSASGESQTASSQLKTMGEDYLELANETTPPNAVNDLVALDTACGMTFTF